ncbi:MAG: peptidylprolyl isomerase, partial [Oscillospiraceae bacterium]
GVLKDISENKDKYIKDAEELKKHKSTKGATAQHVLINKESTKTDNPEALAKEVCEKAKKGEDFAALITQYNEDPGATPAGYTFGPGEMVKEFQDAAFALDIDGISDVVKTDYGFHVIKRLLGGYEVLAKWTEECKIEKNDSAIKKTDVSGIVTEGIEAQKKIQAAQAQAQAAQQQVESGAAQAGQPAAQPAAQPAGE